MKNELHSRFCSSLKGLRWAFRSIRNCQLIVWLDLYFIHTALHASPIFLDQQLFICRWSIPLSKAVQSFRRKSKSFTAQRVQYVTTSLCFDSSRSYLKQIALVSRFRLLKGSSCRDRIMQNMRPWSFFFQHQSWWLQGDDVIRLHVPC